MSDPIAEMLTKIRNAQRVGKKDVILSASKLKLSIGKILEKEGFVESVLKERIGNFEKILSVEFINFKNFPSNILIGSIQSIKLQL